jgi:hypothetical protein
MTPDRWIGLKNEIRIRAARRCESCGVAVGNLSERFARVADARRGHECADDLLLACTACWVGLTSDRRRHSEPAPIRHGATAMSRKPPVNTDEEQLWWERNGRFLDGIRLARERRRAERRRGGRRGH